MTSSLPELNIEEFVLKYMHEKSLEEDKGINYEYFNLNQIYDDPAYPNKNSVDFDIALERLKENGYIRKEAHNMIFFTFKGLIHYEENYLIPSNYYYINIFSIILDIFRRIEQREITLIKGVINLAQFEEELKNNEFFINKRKIYDILAFIELKGNLIQRIGFKGVGYSEELIIFRIDLPILTNKGRDFLNLHKTAKLVFQKVQPKSKRLLLEEYFEIFNLWKRKKWRDIAIKMGSILECLITDFFKQNEALYISEGLKPPGINNTFHEKLLFIKRNDLLGDPNDWNYVDNVMRDYRNLIHLYKVIDENLTIDETTINLLRPYFEKLIQLF
jgi:hypothetical protein